MPVVTLTEGYQSRAKTGMNKSRNSMKESTIARKSRVTEREKLKLGKQKA